MPTTSTLLVTDPARPRWDGDGPRPLPIHFWEPDGPGPHPVVLLSHGTGGRASDLAWLAETLSRAGFLVAATDHHGNTSAGDYLPEGFAFVWERPTDLSRVLDVVLARGDADPARVGAAGFSLGGYTTIALLGGRIDPVVATLVLAGAAPLPPLPEYPDLVDALRARHDEAEIAAPIAAGAGSRRDARVRAGFAIAPSIGALVDPASLAEITAPLALRWGDADDNAVPEDNALAYLAGVPTASGHSVGSDIGHYVFLAASEDPGDVRGTVAQDAVAFFTRELASSAKM
ncbi:alpha/beta hydrolase family protein [Microbacterium sp. bgisy203]|uniref:alpha/beta hydrolase family protein n=1 Tax=Microbacterium sp. bgisy203 TaxID=3413799 RepID=UPI003D7507C4